MLRIQLVEANGFGKLERVIIKILQVSLHLIVTIQLFTKFLIRNKKI
jgi:hypothetical protein